MEKTLNFLKYVKIGLKLFEQKDTFYMWVLLNFVANQLISFKDIW